MPKIRITYTDATHIDVELSEEQAATLALALKQRDGRHFALDQPPLYLDLFSVRSVHRDLGGRTVV